MRVVYSRIVRTVGAGNGRGLGLLAADEYAHERIVRVEVLVKGIDLILGHSHIAQRQGDRGKQAAVERRKVRREDEPTRDSQYLLDFGRVTMVAHAIGLEVFVCKAVVGALGRLLAGARHA